MTGYTASLTQAALAYYYFDFTNDVKTKTLSCLRSIILQLAKQTAGTMSLEALQKTYPMGTPPAQEFLGVLKSLISQCNRVYIVVDALDECTDQEDLFDLLNSIRDWELECLSILVTSRDEPDIRECVDPTAEQEILLNNSGIDNDIRSFIVETLRKDKKLRAWTELFSEIEEALTNGAQGMFRWVDCQMQTLRRCSSRADVRKALEDLPETLDKTYERILRNIHPNLREYAFRLLQWLCIAESPIDIENVMDAFAASMGEEPHFDPDARFVSSDKVLALCPGLIFVVVANSRSFSTGNHNMHKDCIEIAHYSVKEYLVSDRLPAAPDPLCKFRIQEPLANLAMAKTCLVYAIWGPHQSDFQSGFVCSFAQFARLQWHDFYQKAEKGSRLTELAISYLTRKKGHSLDGNIDAAMGFAIENGLDDIERYLLDHYRPSVDPSLALLANCNLMEFPSLDFVDFWIEQGADVNALSVNQRLPHAYPLGSRPLHFAAYGGNVALAQALLQHGASREARNAEGLTPLMALLRPPGHLEIEFIKLFWFDGAEKSLDRSLQNLLHQASILQPHSGDEVLMRELVIWLLNRGVSPHSKDCEGDTPLHKAALWSNTIAIETLCAATARLPEYGGCLITFLRTIRYRECRLSSAQLLFEIDPNPFGPFRDGSGLLSWVLVVSGDIDDRAFGSRFTALFLTHDEDPAHTKLDFYMSFLENMIKGGSSDKLAIIRWLAMKLVEQRDLDFLGTEVWFAALDTLTSGSLYWTTELEAREGINNLFQQVRELFENREIFGVGIRELYQLLLREVLDRGPLAELIISQEPAYVELGLSDEIQTVPRSYSVPRSRPMTPCESQHTFMSLMLHREIHPDTQNEEGEATLLDAIIHGGLEMTRLLIKRLLLKRACDMNHQNPEGLTPLTGVVSYFSYNYCRSEVLKSFLAAGCDGDIQDNAGRTPLMIAAYRGLDDLAELLLDAGCNANLQDREGGTPVTEAVYDGVNDGVDDWAWESIYRVDQWKRRKNLWKERFSPIGGHTALMYAVMAGERQVVKLLLKNACDVTLKNNDDQTALDLARQFEENDIVQILLGLKQHEQSDNEEYQQSDHEEYEQSDHEEYEQSDYEEYTQRPL